MALVTRLAVLMLLLPKLRSATVVAAPAVAA